MMNLKVFQGEVNQRNEVAGRLKKTHNNGNVEKIDIYLKPILTLTLVGPGRDSCLDLPFLFLLVLTALLPQTLFQTPTPFSPAWYGQTADL